MTWDNSRRRQELPPNWPTLRRAVATRASGICQQPGCNQPGTDCDHIADRHNHDLNNLQWLCAAHHKTKTAADLAATRAKLRHPMNR